MNQIENKKKWDAFDDRLTRKYEEEGIAELGRWYKKSGDYIEYYMTNPNLAPIVAFGITAFLSDNNVFSFHAAVEEKSWQPGIDLHEYFKSYYGHCKTFLRENERRRTFFKDERKSDIELTQSHFESEKQMLSEPQLLFSEVADESKWPTIKIIKKAAFKYLEWLKETQFIVDIQKNSTESITKNEILDSSLQEKEKPLTLDMMFESVSKYTIIMDMLVLKDYIQPFTYKWKDEKNRNKTFLSTILKFLFLQNYYKTKPSNEQYIEIAQNTFGLKIGIDTMKRANPEQSDLSFIPLASTIE